MQKGQCILEIQSIVSGGNCHTLPPSGVNPSFGVVGSVGRENLMGGAFICLFVHLLAGLVWWQTGGIVTHTFCLVSMD